MGEEKERIGSFLTEEDFDRPASSTQAFYRWPFSASLFSAVKRRGPSNTQDRRGTTHWQAAEERREQGEKWRTNQMALHQLLCRGSTCSALQWAPVWVSGPPFRGAVGHPDLPRHPLHRPERRWAPRRRRVVAEHQADTSRDKMVG